MSDQIQSGVAGTMARYELMRAWFHCMVAASERMLYPEPEAPENLIADCYR